MPYLSKIQWVYICIFLFCEKNWCKNINFISGVCFVYLLDYVQREFVKLNLATQVQSLQNYRTTLLIPEGPSFKLKLWPHLTNFTYKENTHTHVYINKTHNKEITQNCLAAPHNSKGKI